MDTENKDKANEPQSAYNNKIVFFNSFEEMNEYDYRERATLSPEEALSEVTYMRLTQYPELNTNMNPWGNLIYIDEIKWTL